MPLLDEIEAAIPALRAYARALLRQREGADDLVQDTLEAALARQGQWRGEGSVRGWMFRILLNRFRDGRRRAWPGRRCRWSPISRFPPRRRRNWH